MSATKEQSGRWFFTADCHFGHANIIKYCKRPFLTPDEQAMSQLVSRGVIPVQEFKIPWSAVDKMNSQILSSINDAVLPEDHLVIVGDFCFAQGSKMAEATRKYRDRINCKNVYLILGNHDRRKACEGVFTACYENYLFNIGGQLVFASHYPMRSWDRASHGAWSVYGHVHNMYHAEDNGKLMPYAQKMLHEGFASVLERHGISGNETIIQDLLKATAILNGVDLTVDVGVDNVREGVPFGTPWSMDELRQYMDAKFAKWHARHNQFKSFR